MAQTVSNTMLPLTKIEDTPRVVGFVRLRITSLDPRGMTCTKEEWDGTRWIPLNPPPPGPNPTRFDLSLDHIPMGLSTSQLVAYGEIRTVDVIQVRIKIDPSLTNVRFDKTYGVTAGSAEGSPLLKSLEIHSGERDAMFLSLRRGYGKGALPYNIGLLLTDTHDPNYEMVVFYDPKIENDGSITDPPPPPPPPPPWP